MNKKITNKLEQIKDYININKKSLVYYFITTFIIYLIALTPLIRANFNYADDSIRNLTGERGWENYSRYLNNFLSTIIHPNRFLTDISPFPLILSIIVLCLSSMILIYKISDNNEFSFWKVASVIPLGLSPYFLQCLSYKYDSVYMAISILVCIIPIIFYNKKWYVYSISTIICIICMCTIYQASSGIYLMLVLIIALKKWNNKENSKDILFFVSISAISYIIGLFMFKTLIMKDTNSFYASTMVFPLDNLFKGITNNVLEYLRQIRDTLTNFWIIIITIISISFIISSCIKSKQKIYFSIPVSIIVIILMVISSFGMYTLLEKPVFSPRGLYGFGIYIALISLYSIDIKKNYISKIACVLLAWVFINFALTYGNALSEQKRYMDFKAQTIINDLNSLEIFNNYEQNNILFLDGNTFEISPVLLPMCSEYKILKNLINEGSWFPNYFINYFGLIKSVRKYEKLNKEDMVLIKDTIYHSIYRKENKVLIILK